MPSSKSGPGSKSAAPPEEAQSAVYFEFIPAGGAMRVNAIDEKTGIEVTIVGPVSASRMVLEQAALQKLRYVLARSK